MGEVSVIQAGQGALVVGTGEGAQVGLRGLARVEVVRRRKRP